MGATAKAIATIATMLVVLIVLAIGGAIWWSDHSAKALAVKEQTVAAKAVVGQGQAQAAQQAQQIVVSGQARDRIDLEVHQSNDQAIAAAPGADQPLDPRLNHAGLVGLCRHPAFQSDPGCHRLLEGDPPVLSPASPADGSTPY